MSQIEIKRNEATANSRAEDIQTRLRQRSFHPFRLIATEGLRCDIFHPELVLVGRRNLAVGFPSRRNPAIYDQLIRVALVHVVGLEDPPAVAELSNGTSESSASP